MYRLHEFHGSGCQCLKTDYSTINRNQLCRRWALWFSQTSFFLLLCFSMYRFFVVYVFSMLLPWTRPASSAETSSVAKFSYSHLPLRRVCSSKWLTHRTLLTWSCSLQERYLCPRRRHVRLFDVPGDSVASISIGPHPLLPAFTETNLFVLFI